MRNAYAPENLGLKGANPDHVDSNGFFTLLADKKVHMI